MAKEFAVSTALSRAPLGLEAPLVRVEVHLGNGLPNFLVVGLPEAVVRESKERVRAALVTSGFSFPVARITVNLSPADLPKEGGRFDLPIAIGILAASGQLPRHALDRREFYGELSLSGELRDTTKLLPALVAGAALGNELIVPAANALEASLAENTRIRLADNLLQVCAALQHGTALRTAARASPVSASRAPDIAEICGQFTAKRGLEIAAAGDHCVLLVGPPGAGKTMLAQRLPGLLPPLCNDEALEVASLESAAGGRPASGLGRPFRNPHHTASIAALIGGAGFRPGELSRAHLGVLFLDELPEFARNVLEALREPLESGIVVLARAKRTCEFPARFQLIAAMNPCPCGYHGEPRGRCRCTESQVRRYRNRISGPLLDRIDIHLEVPALPAAQLTASSTGQAERSAAVALRVRAAREVQLHRQGKLNARLDANETTRLCRLDRPGCMLAQAAIARLGLSARAYQRILKLARTCADLAAQPEIAVDHVAEAVRLRVLDRQTPA